MNILNQISTHTGKKYLDALLRVDLFAISQEWSEDTLDNFIWSHLFASAKNGKVDLVRTLLAFMEKRDEGSNYIGRLHKVLTTTELATPSGEEREEDADGFDNQAPDENVNTFKKTALAWAVENHDR